MKREKFGTRLGFILISAGCAIGLGNVWRFPYITGQYGGAAFVLIYLVCLVMLGLPIMIMEFSVGRAAGCSIARAFDKLEPLAVSAPEAARLLGVSKPTIYQYIHRDDFPAFKLGNRTLVSVDGLKEWIRKQVNEQ